MAQKTIESAGFRPNEAEAKIIIAAEQATGRNRSYLLRRCMAKAIGEVVKEILDTHNQAVRNFDLVLKEAASADADPSGHPTEPVTYKIPKRAHDPPKRKAG